MNRLLLATGAAVCGALGLGYWLGRSTRPTPSAERPAAEVSARANFERPVAQKPPAPAAPMRARIVEAIERAPVRGSADLDEYLDTLEARARRQRAVTALEIEPGLAMIRRHADNPDKLGQFSERMLKLQRELTGKDARAPTDPIQIRSQLDDLLGRIEQTSSQRERQEATRRYVRLALELAEDEQAARLRQLTMAQGVKVGETDPHLADVLWDAIEVASEEAQRQELIREYLSVVGQLEDAEREQRLARVHARYGSGTQVSR